MVMENGVVESVREQENGEIELGFGGKSNQKKKRYSLISRFLCMRSNGGITVVEKPDVHRSFNVVAATCNGNGQKPRHLIVMVNGIIGSESNSSLLTLDGIDVMGKRLANEVISLADRHSNLEKISFVGHSLGGLVARYAIAVLYRQDLKRKPVEESGEHGGKELNKASVEEKMMATIAGLEPVNFITSATPHLGSRGHKQIPMLCGFQPMEKVAMHGSRIFRKTGKHLFLRDKDNGKPPLLLQMSYDSDDLKFISALQLFRRRVAYANASSDQIVGWGTSSVRRVSELPKRRNLVKNAEYRYIFNEETSKTANTRMISLNTKVARGRTSEMEEAMIKALTHLSWERVDVNFRKSIQRFLAHNTIQVKTYSINSHGAHVIRHMVDNFHI